MAWTLHTHEQCKLRIEREKDTNSYSISKEISKALQVILEEWLLDFHSFQSFVASLLPLVISNLITAFILIMVNGSVFLLQSIILILMLIYFTIKLREKVKFKMKQKKRRRYGSSKLTPSRKRYWSTPNRHRPRIWKQRRFYSKGNKRRASRVATKGNNCTTLDADFLAYRNRNRNRNRNFPIFVNRKSAVGPPNLGRAQAPYSSLSFCLLGKK